MSNEFKPTSEILDRPELTAIWNYWVSKYNLLNRQKLTKGKTQEMRTINDYLNELKIRDKELISENRSNAAKKRADQKRRAEEEALRQKLEEEQVNRQKKLVFDAEFPAFNKECSDINAEIDSLQKQIQELKHKKYEIQKGFQDKCVHRYGKQMSEQWSCRKWVVCEICGYEDTTYDNW